MKPFHVVSYLVPAEKTRELKPDLLPQIIVPATVVLARDAAHASQLAARDIPAEWLPLLGTGEVRIDASPF